MRWPSVGNGGRDVAEGVEIFEQKALEGRLHLGVTCRRFASAPAEHSIATAGVFLGSNVRSVRKNTCRGRYCDAGRDAASFSRMQSLLIFILFPQRHPPVPCRILQIEPRHAHRRHIAGNNPPEDVSTSLSGFRSAASRSEYEMDKGKPARCSSDQHHYASIPGITASCRIHCPTAVSRRSGVQYPRAGTGLRDQCAPDRRQSWKTMPARMKIIAVPSPHITKR